MGSISFGKFESLRNKVVEAGFADEVSLTTVYRLDDSGNVIEKLMICEDLLDTLGVMVVRKGDCEGVIDKDGEYVVDLTSESDISFYGSFLVSDDGSEITIIALKTMRYEKLIGVDANFEVVPTGLFVSFRDAYDFKTGILSPEGEWIFPLMGSTIMAPNFIERILPAGNFELIHIKKLDPVLIKEGYGIKRYNMMCEEGGITFAFHARRHEISYTLMSFDSDGNERIKTVGYYE